jgi:hypothetical protein
MTDSLIDKLKASTLKFVAVASQLPDHTDPG